MSRTYPMNGPVARTLELVGERWTLLILLEILKGSHRFADINGSLVGISPNLLSTRLKSLEENGVVERRFYSSHPPRAEYILTSKGHELGIVAGALAVWGSKYLADDISLLHSRCGEKVDVIYYCDKCSGRVKRSQVKLS